jgi:acyl-CoA thioesterase-1
MKRMMGMVLGLAACGCAFGAERPNVLIIGDSISGGYTPFVMAALSNRMEVVRTLGNNAATVTGLKRLDQWLGTKKWDVIHFNWGLHDLKYIDPATAEMDMAKLVAVDKGRQWVPVEQYEPNLLKLVQRLKKSGAKLVWCATTPVPAGASGRVPGDEVKYNAAALRVMQAEGVPVNDLWAFVGSPERRLALGGRPKDVHYTDAGSKALADEVVKAIEQALGGWTELFDGRSLAGWRPYGKPVGTPVGEGWKVEEGLLHKLPGTRGGDIISERQYTDFELEWEWRLAKDANNGIKYCVTESRPGAPGYEYQMIDDASGRFKNTPAKTLTASFYEVLAPAADKPLKPAGEWNVSRVVVQGDRAEHWLNGEKVLEYVFGSDAVKAGVAESKFAKFPDFGTKLTGHVMLTDHTDEAWYRRVSIRVSPSNGR